MKQLDRLIYKEIVGPWVFGVGLFAALLMAGTWLNKIADLIVQNVGMGPVAELVMLLFPAVIVKTFTMAVLLAALLAFGRLSSDSEIVALKAGGASIFRIVRPVMAFSIGIAILTFAFNETVVPTAATRSKLLLNQLADKGQNTEGNPVSFPIAERGKLKAQIVAKAFNPGARLMRGVTIVSYNKQGQTSYFLSAPEMVFRDSKDWEIRGTSRLVDAKGGFVLDALGARPDAVTTITKSPADILLLSNNDPDLMSMAEVKSEIDRGRAAGDLPAARLANMEYWYWNKIALPLAAFVFGTMGAVLGIRNHRTGSAAGFALAIAIIFGYVTLTNFMNVWAQGGVLPPWLASFAPVALGLVASIFIMWKRNS